MVETSGGTNCRRSYPFGRAGCGGYGRPRRCWKLRPKSRVSSTQVYPTTRHSGTSPTRTAGSCPGPGEGTSSRPTICRGVVDQEHQVIVAARATISLRTSSRQRPSLRGPSVTRAPCPGRCPPPLGTTRRKRWRNSAFWEWTPSSPRRSPPQLGSPPAPRGRIPNGLSTRDRKRRKLRTRRGQQRYALRMDTVEPVFGQIKQGRGFRHSCCGPGEGQRRVVAALHRPQPAEAVPVRRRYRRQRGENRPRSSKRECFPAGQGHVILEPTCIHTSAPYPNARLSIIAGQTARGGSFRVSIEVCQSAGAFSSICRLLALLGIGIWEGGGIILPMKVLNLGKCPLLIESRLRSSWQRLGGRLFPLGLRIRRGLPSLAELR